MIATLELFVAAIVVGATLYMRNAILSLNHDLRSLLANQGDMAGHFTIAFDVTKASIDQLEKRIKVLEDEVL